MNIIIQVATPKHKDLPSKTFIKNVLALPSTLATHPKREVLVRIVASDEMQKLNNAYRHKDYPTNVLSFPSKDLPGLESVSLGDIIICHEVLKIEAKAQHKSLQDHYAHMLIHGFLHLLGYDHLNPKDAAQMEQLEINLLAKLNIKNPYEEIHE